MKYVQSKFYSEKNEGLNSIVNTVQNKYLISVVVLF